MYHFKTIHLFFIPLFFLSTCNVSRFYPDPDDQGLSRFTARGYNVASEYVNGIAYSNTGSYNPLLQKVTTGSLIDTLQFGWSLYPTGVHNTNDVYGNIRFSLPISQSFSKTNLLGLNGQRFINSVPFILIDTLSYISRGTATLYFVAITSEKSSNNEKYVRLSGLFDGNIGDTVLVTKGRFDFEIQESKLNF